MTTDKEDTRRPEMGSTSGRMGPAVPVWMLGTWKIDEFREEAHMHAGRIADCVLTLNWTTPIREIKRKKRESCEKLKNKMTSFCCFLNNANLILCPMSNLIIMCNASGHVNCKQRNFELFRIHWITAHWSVTSQWWHLQGFRNINFDRRDDWSTVWSLLHERQLLQVIVEVDHRHEISLWSGECSWLLKEMGNGMEWENGANKQMSHTCPLWKQQNTITTKTTKQTKKQ